MTDKTVVRTDGAPAAPWIFSQGLRIGSLLQVSGQGPQHPVTGEFQRGDVRKQTLQTLDNVREILTAGGAGMEDVLMLRVYLTKREDFAAMNEVYGEFMKRHVPGGAFPCRTTVFVGLPNEGMLVEIDALAVLR